ncbi:MAG: hypothetical protein HOV83_14690, partial [Catenulispora sp.]|nr:hypothetical protein [Catenulispora sp.]
LLGERCDIDGLRERADTDDPYAADRLAKLLAERGDHDGAITVLRERANAGDPSAAERLAELLAGRGDLDGLRERADTGDSFAVAQLMELLERIDPQEADRIRRSGLSLDE